jgi:transmembrane sensor
MLNDRIAALIARSLAREATAEELQELDEHMRLHPSDQYFKDLLISYWNLKDETPEQPALNPDDHFRDILRLAGEEQTDTTRVVEMYDNLVRRQKRNAWVRRLAAAAIIGGIIFGAWKFFPSQNKTATARAETVNEVETKKGVRGTKVVLPDGSQVWLNSESRLVYGRSFNDSLREVELEGEAYFDVVRDHKKPFVVHTSGIDIRVLGTAFNVKSYSAEPTIETTLVHGMIEIVRKNQPGAPRKILHPHQKDVFNKSAVGTAQKTEIVGVIPADTVTKLPQNLADTSIVETSWVYNKLRFEKESFDKVAMRMERWFNVKITIKDEKMSRERLNGSFTIETVDEALQALQLTVPFVYTKKGDEIEINKK